MNPVIRWFHQLGSPPYFDRFAARWAPWCWLAALLLMGVGSWQALFSVPADYQQGDSFRILYIHVPAACVSSWTCATRPARRRCSASRSTTWAAPTSKATST